MSEGGQARGRSGTRGREQEPDEQVEPEQDDASRELLDDVDELLDEIDDVLEENAEEFVRGYVQKGGQ